MKRFKLFLPLIIFVALAGLLFVGLKKDPNDLPSALIGKPVPAFSLPSLHDPEKNITTDMLKGEAYLLNIWATWCPACKVEHPFLIDLAREGVPIYGVNYKDNRDNALRELARAGDPFRLSVTDDDGRLGLDLGVYGAPETFIVDGNGIIRYRLAGVIDKTLWTEEMAPIFYAQTP